MTPPKPSRETPSDLRLIWLAATAFWLLVGLLYLGQIWLLTRESGMRVVITRGTIIWQSAFYLSWIPLTVLLGRLTRSWDVAQLGWRRLIGRHTALFLAVAALEAAFVAGVGLALVPERETAWTAIISQLRARLYQDVVMYLAVVMSTQAVVLYGRARAREVDAAQLEAQLQAARLDSLRAQLHPHFLFNTLHTIASLVRDNRNDEAVRLISGMSDLLRRLLDSTAPTHPIEEELAAAGTYLDVQRARFGARLTTDVTLSGNAAGAQVPVLVVQPLLENAFRHGLADQIEAGQVQVGVRREADDLVIQVDDTGCGVPPDWRPEEAGGTGLANLRGRLGALYGDRGRLVAGPRAQGGFGVTIRLPFSLA